MLQQNTKHKYFDFWLEHLGKSPVLEDAEMFDQPDDHIPSIAISASEWQEYSHKWNKSLIKNTVGIARPIIDIQRHLTGLWRISGKLEVVELGKGFHVVKMLKQEDYLIALAGGPWFLFDHFLAVQQWKIDFAPSDGLLQTMLVWIQLHELPLELYDMRALAKIGKAIGRPMKGDVHTVDLSRGRYARICLEVGTTQPLTSSCCANWKEKATYYLFSVPHFSHC